MTPTIVVQNVSKWYGQVVAVSDLSIEVGPGVTGLLGPNGAGKTTLFKMIAGLLVPNQGVVRVLGESVRAKPALYRKIGFCPETESLYDFMTGLEFLKFNAELHGLPHPDEAARRALERVHLAREKDKKIGAYSRGMRQRIKLAQALLHDPEILLLDEPLKGADPTQRVLLIEIIRELGEQGRTVIVSSHVLYEVERMAREILLIHRGRLVAAGDFRAIREALYDRPHRVLVGTADAKRLAALLTERALVSGVTISDSELIVEVRDPALFYSGLPRLVAETGIRVERLVGLDEDLESVFRYLVQ
ncbi:MAG: ABC transporter ATP-binding protein [Candidatus Bipolaricaulota bacterium]|nr:ABC transporter ATP-binding protein [Candidatus Bipolaricaulota bacterium]MDW8111158.1 ABC transporter ATP-binding protein [Candidatus Bipolaricaulota bacterium]